MKLTVVYDNTSLSPRLVSKWGFACLVNDDLLFDTGGDGSTLLANMAELGIDPARIEAVVLSHAHGDHTGGLAGLLSTGARPAVYVLGSFPFGFKADVGSLTGLVEVDGPAQIRPGMHTTGEVASRIPEQALAVETGEGLVVLTGCAHPGVVEMVRRAKESAGGEVAMVIGGFHLGSASRKQIAHVIADFRTLGVRRVAPCHCTGDEAMLMLAEEYQADCLKVGVGRVIADGSERRAE